MKKNTNADRFGLVMAFAMSMLAALALLKVKEQEQEISNMRMTLGAQIEISSRFLEEPPICPNEYMKIKTDCEMCPGICERQEITMYMLRRDIQDMESELRFCRNHLAHYDAFEVSETE